MFWPITALHLCASRGEGKLVHAAINTLGGPTRRRTVDAVCGAKRLRLNVGECVSTEGHPLGARILAWPPRANEKGGRCADCWEATGRPRPSSLTGVTAP